MHFGLENCFISAAYIIAKPFDSNYDMVKRISRQSFWQTADNEGSYFIDCL